MNQPVSRKVFIAATGGLLAVCQWLSAAGVPDRAGTAGSAGDAGKVKLAAIPLQAPEWVASKSDASPAIRLQLGAVLPKHIAVFTAERPEQELMIAGASVKLMSDGRSFGLGTEMGAAALQRMANGGWRPMAARIDRNRSYLLGFPYGVPGQRGVLHYRSGFAMRGLIGGKPVFIYDDNVDGVFSAEHDTYRFGDSPSPAMVFAPLGKYIPTPGGVYQLDSVAEDGSGLTYSKYTGDAGKFALAFASDGAELQAVFGDKQGDFVAIAHPSRPVELTTVPGAYRLRYGIVYSPAAHKIAAAVTAGKMQPIQVGGTDSAEKPVMGGPLTLEFKVRRAGNKMTIDPSSFAIRGRAGEEYTGVKYAKEPIIGMLAGGRAIPLGKMDFG